MPLRPDTHRAGRGLRLTVRVRPSRGLQYDARPQRPSTLVLVPRVVLPIVEQEVVRLDPGEVAKAQLSQTLELNRKTPTQGEPDGVAGASPFLIRVVQVTTTLSGLPANVIQGPDINIPRGYDTAVVMRRHTGSPTGYFSYERTGVLDNLRRTSMKDADTRGVAVGNWNQLWFGADFTVGTAVEFELIVERNPRGT